jgi:predicted PurR-regulated permease PerM
VKDAVYGFILFVVGIPAALLMAIFVTALNEKTDGGDDE